MFGKDRDSGSYKMETVIGQNTIIQGTLSSKGAIRVDGKVEGGIAEAQAVVVGESGEINGDITAGSVSVGGKVVGNIIATQSIEILSNATIHGDLKTASLSIAEGASFEGNCIMTKEKSQVIELDAAAAAGNKQRR